MKWLPKPNNWSKVVVVKFYTYVSEQNEKDGIKCYQILKCKCMNSFDFAAYTKWRNNRMKEV